jgi:thiosulfate dehydrogenase
MIHPQLRMVPAIAVTALAAVFSVPLWRTAKVQAQAPSGAELKTMSVSSEPVARTWTLPDVAKIPKDARGESIRMGLHIFQETPKFAAEYVGNQVSCGNCHIQMGSVTFAMPLIGAPTWFPQYSQRAKRKITLEDRIQECVTRSENGKPLPHDGPEMRALFDFFDWLQASYPADKPIPARGLAVLPELKADLDRGEKVYSEKCAACHGKDGAGVPPILPPLWGPGAYNDGAGMNQPVKMAAFVLHNMPQNKPGSLTPQEAFDVSSYVASKPHPAYNHEYDNF